jgi:glucose 1-dehydrogenase
MNLQGKAAIVTGGNTGIGKAIVLALAHEGANVVIDYIADEQSTEDLEKQVVALGNRAVGVDADVSKVADLETLVSAAVKNFGRLDIMVNNAGVETRTSILDTTEQQYEKVLEINLKSAFFGTQLAAKQMIAQGGCGRNINVTSVHKIGRCRATRRTACRRAACACSPAPPASSSGRTASRSSVSVPGRWPHRSTRRRWTTRPR